jgi:L-cysteine/cystine lyase
MKFNRKNFIRSAAMLAACSLGEIGSLAAREQAACGAPDMAPDDEAYWRQVRLLFPLSGDLTFLNNGTIGPSPYPVTEAVRQAMMEEDKFCAYSGWESAAGKLASFVGADADEIALTHNTTEGINTACWGLPLRKGDEVIMTTHEHAGNALPWLNRQHLHRIVIKVFTPAPAASETLGRIAALITPRTRVIAVPHIPCTQGQILPLKDICTLARDKGIYTAIDGAHGPGMLPLDLHHTGCDVYAACCHKWMLGPKGTGFLYVRKDFQDTVQALFMGAGSGSAKSWDMLSAPPDMGGYAPSAHRYYGGTQSLGLYKGVEAAIDFFQTIGMDHIHRRIQSLGKYMQDGLLGFGGKVELLTPTEEGSFCGINGFRIKGVAPEKFYNLCAENKVRIRSVPENGLRSLRVSTHIYNSRREVDKLLGLIRQAG